MKDFANLAENPSVADDLIFQLASSYNIDLTRRLTNLTTNNQLDEESLKR